MTLSNHKAKTKLTGMELHIWTTVSDVKRRLFYLMNIPSREFRVQGFISLECWDTTSKKHDYVSAKPLPTTMKHTLILHLTICNNFDHQYSS